MIITHDWEFLDDGVRIIPISVGMVREDGAQLYRVFDDLPLREIARHPFLSQHVAPHLPLKPPSPGGYADPWDRDHPEYRAVAPREKIREDVKRFITEAPDPQLWAYYAAYDHVCLAQLFGPMMNLPVGIPRQTDDIKTEAKRLGNPKMPENWGPEHHALYDAIHDLEMLRHLRGVELDQRRRGYRDDPVRFLQ